MIDPSQFDSMIDWAFTIATAIYTTIGVTGYLMFGNNVSDEVSTPSSSPNRVSKVVEPQFSQELTITPGYNPTLNRLAVWGLVIAPLSKFALATRPVSHYIVASLLTLVLSLEHSSTSHSRSCWVSIPVPTLLTTMMFPQSRTRPTARPHSRPNADKA